MPESLTVTQVLGLAPDAGSRQAAIRLARPGRWSDLGAAPPLVWGRCQGSAKDPYQVVVDLSGPSSKCSCPSRKFPCKHGLALMLVWAQDQHRFTEVDGAAQWAASYQAPRAGGRAHTGAAGPRAAGDGAGAERKAPDPEAQARRAAEREATMTAGLEDFGLWLGDLVRRGLAAARQEPYAYWDGAAGRLVDAQVPALAERVRAAGSLVRSGGDWAGELLGELGAWFSALKAWERRHQLPPSLREDLRTYLGTSRRKEDIEAAGTVEGSWTLVGVREGGDDRVRSQKTWLWAEDGDDGDDGEWELVLDFAAAGAALQVAAPVGSVVATSLARYPGSSPRRVLMCGEGRVVGTRTRVPGAGPLARALDRGAGYLAANPWLSAYPAALAGARVSVAGPAGYGGGGGGAGAAWLVDEEGDAVAMSPSVPVSAVLALSGGEPVDMFGEIEDRRFVPLTLGLPGRLASL